MSPLNRGSMMGPRVPPAGMRPPMPRFNRGPPPPPMGMGRVPPPPPGMFGPPRGRPIPPPGGMPGRVGPMMPRQAAGMPPGPPPPMFGPGGPRGMMHVPPMPMRGPMMGPHGHGPMMRPGPRGVLPPHALPHHMRPRFPSNNKGKNNSPKKNNKMEDLEMKKPWMTDEIRSEIQKKNKLYAKAKKNKDAKEWEEFKDLRNKVTRMIRDAKNDYLTKHPDQAKLCENEPDFEYDVEEDDAAYAEDEEMSYCETCDREFASPETLERHLREHQTCKIDGCTFTAHPKIVEKHIGMQHATGLYQRMRHVMSDGDLEKWKLERKKRYPTTANAVLQEAQRLEKEMRGEVVKDHNCGAKWRRDNVKKEQTWKNRKKRRNKPMSNSTVEKVKAKIETYRGLQPFAGTAALDEAEDSDAESPKNESVIDEDAVIDDVEENDFDITDEEEEVVGRREEVVEKLVTKIEEPKPEVASLKTIGLVADYGSDSDNDSDEPPEEVPIKRLKTDEEDKVVEKPEPQMESEQNINNLKKEVERESNSCASSGDKKLTIREKKQSVDNKRQFNRPLHKQTNAEYSNGRLRLLNKLLARSIQHERNAIFQCITYIANNNFFD